MKLWLFLLPVTLAAHMVSMSTGELRIAGDTASYELRMPAYEAAHVKNPETTLLQSIRFRSRGVLGVSTGAACSLRLETLVCTALYRFPKPVDEIEVDCSFPSVTVPNHVHLLRAYLDGKSDQAVFDASFPTAVLRFRPPQPWEILLRECGAGFSRAIGGLASLLFLFALAIAARSWPELGSLVAALVAGEIAACALLPRLSFVLSPRFIEAAAALTIAYLAFEVALLPRSGQRWLVVALLGLFHGAYFSLFLSTSGYRLPGFLAGVTVAQALAAALLFPLLHGIVRLSRSPRTVPALASVMMTVGVVWFVVRVWT